MLGRVLSLTFFRVILVSLLLIYQFLGLLAGFPILPFIKVFYIILVVSAMTVFYLWWLRHQRNNQDLSKFVFFQFTVDIVIVSLLVVISGGEGSNLRFAYLLLIILSAVFLDRILIYVIMVVSLGFYLLALNTSAYLSQPLATMINLPLGVFVENDSLLLGQVLLCLVTAYLSAFMRNVYDSGRKALALEEERVRSLKEIRRKIVESLPSGLLTADEGGWIDFVNRQGQKILKQSETTLRGQKIWDLFHIPQPRDGNTEMDTLSRRECRVEVGGVKRIMGISFRPLSLETGKHGYMVVYQDISQIKLLEAHKLLADKMAAVGKVAAGVAHEIRNPLASISGSIQVLREVLPEDPTAKDLADIVAKETKRLDTIISEFLAYAKPLSPPHFEPFDLRDCLEDFLHLTSNDPKLKHIQFRKDFDAHACFVLADRAKLTQVFWNLIKNSAQACQDNPQILVYCHKEEEYIMVAVADNGIGMTEEQLKDIFTPFQSFSKLGTGLGMSIVYDIVQMHHGEIAVASQPGEGTRITIKLPRHDE